MLLVLLLILSFRFPYSLDCLRMRGISCCSTFPRTRTRTSSGTEKARYIGEIERGGDDMIRIRTGVWIWDCHGGPKGG